MRAGKGNEEKTFQKEDTLVMKRRERGTPREASNVSHRWEDGKKVGTSSDLEERGTLSEAGK